MWNKNKRVNVINVKIVRRVYKFIRVSGYEIKCKGQCKFFYFICDEFGFGFGKREPHNFGIGNSNS